MLSHTTVQSLGQVRLQEMHQQAEPGRASHARWPGRPHPPPSACTGMPVTLACHAAPGLAAKTIIY